MQYSYTSSLTTDWVRKRSQIRACVPEDMPRIADVFRAVFQGLPGPAPTSLHQYLLELFFEAPWHDPELPSLVYIAPDDMVRGFIGVTPLRMLFQGKQIRAALGSQYMVENAKDNPLAGVALLKAFINGPQDVSITESANSIAVPLWTKLGATLAVGEHALVAGASSSRVCSFAFGKTTFSVKVARPICMATDSVATPRRFRLKAKVAARTIDADLNDHFLTDYLRDFAAQYSLRPFWDTDSLRWRLNHAAQNRHRGSLVCRAVYGKAMRPFGCYLYYARRNGVANVLQLMTSPDGAGIVLDSLLEDAYQKRCVAVRGRTHSRYMDQLLLRDCIFRPTGAVLLHSRNAKIMETACSGNALLIGLAGEEWTRIDDVLS